LHATKTQLAEDSRLDVVAHELRSSFLRRRRVVHLHLRRPPERRPCWPSAIPCELLRGPAGRTSGTSASSAAAPRQLGEHATGRPSPGSSSERTPRSPTSGKRQAGEPRHLLSETPAPSPSGSASSRRSPRSPPPHTHTLPLQLRLDRGLPLRHRTRDPRCGADGKSRAGFNRRPLVRGSVFDRAHRGFPSCRRQSIDPG
jgi:hypothetical protein